MKINCTAPVNIASILVVWVVLTWIMPNSICFAEAPKGHEAVSALIAIVESGELGQAKNAESLFATIPSDSNTRAIAAYSLALIQIREAKHAEALRTLLSINKEQDTVSDSIKFGAERLRLWLLLEVGSAEESEVQFKKLVIMTLGTKPTNSEQVECYGLIGAVIGMLKTEQESSCIARPILDKAQNALRARIQNKNANLKMEERLSEAGTWGGELSELADQYESIGREKAEEQHKFAQTECAKTKEEQIRLRGELKSVGQEKQTLEDNRRALFKNRNGTLAEMKLETPGKPSFPVQPGPPPVEPSGEYKTDARTQQTKYVPPSNSDQREYEDRDRKWRKAFANFQRDRQEYPEKKRLWELKDSNRREGLRTQLNALESGIHQVDQAIVGLMANAKQGVGKELKETAGKLKRLEREATISSIAMKQFGSGDSHPEKLIRPSHFQLLDYSSESLRLRQAIR